MHLPATTHATAAPLSLPQLYVLPGAEAAGAALAPLLGAAPVGIEVHRFPDGECKVRLLGAPLATPAVLVANLHRPDAQALPLLFAADALRELGATRVLLAAPYLPYLRQDARFAPGEAVSSRSFARFVDLAFDGLATVDPHLHRHPTLGAVYRQPARAVASAPAIAAWLRQAVPQPCLVGPDDESRQWVAHVAALAGCPYQVLAKVRQGDRTVQVSPPDAALLLGRTPVLLDDMASSGHTLAEAAGQLRRAGHAAPLCVVVHALLDTAGERLLADAGLRLVSCHTVPHASNAIDVMPDLAAALRHLAAPG